MSFLDKLFESSFERTKKVIKRFEKDDSLNLLIAVAIIAGAYVFEKFTERKSKKKRRKK